MIMLTVKFDLGGAVTLLLAAFHHVQHLTDLMSDDIDTDDSQYD